jgi:hypothetical protein
MMLGCPRSQETWGSSPDIFERLFGLARLLEQEAGSDQVLAMELSNHLNVFEHIRLALEVPERARDRGVGSYRVELAPTFESAMSLDCEFEQAVHVNLGSAKERVAA